VPIPPEAPVTSAFRPFSSRIAGPSYPRAGLATLRQISRGRESADPPTPGRRERKVSVVADPTNGAPLITVWSDYI
jgi:hypothetical protein